MKKSLFILTLALALALPGLYACVSSAPNLALVQELEPSKGARAQRVSENSDCYSLQIDYPVLDQPVIDKKIRDWVDTRYNSATAEFNSFCAHVAPKQPFKLWVEYDLFMMPNTASVVFKSLIYAGGDQYHDWIEARNYLRENGTDLDFEALFSSTEGLPEALSKYAVGQFKPALGEIWKENPEYADALNPKHGPFNTFAITKTGLLLYFPTRKIAPFYAGPQECAVPLDAVKKFGPSPGIWP